jgi:meckelin
VLPTSSQQISFTVLVVVAFVLKTFDILHLIIRQASTDMFFIDWEKPKAGMKNFLIIGNFFVVLGNANTVSVWRTYFVANEFHEIQTFRRINPTFQLFFVLFLLKVIKILFFFRIWINLNWEILFLR